MEALRNYLNGRKPSEQEAFARRCKTTIGYLRKMLSTRDPIGAEIVIEIERQSGGAVRCEDLRPDIDWSHLRGITPAEPRRSGTKH